MALHGLRKVLDLHHGYSVCQSHEVGMNALECPLCIHTHDVVSSSPPSMIRETIRSLWSNICIHMTYCHYVSSPQNMYFESKYQKTQKKINNSKNFKSGFGIRYLCHHMLLLVVGACPDIHGILSLHRDSH